MTEWLEHTHTLILVFASPTQIDYCGAAGIAIKNETSRTTGPRSIHSKEQIPVKVQDKTSSCVPSSVVKF